MTTAASKQRKMFSLLAHYIGYVLIAFLFIAPIVYLVVSSLKNDTQIVADMSTFKAFLPVGELSLDNYVAVIQKVDFLKFFKNSAVVAVIYVGVATIINGMIGYALGMLEFKGKRLVISLVIALSVIPTEAVIINRFLVANELGILNSYIGLAIPTVAYPMFMFLYYNHFKGMPKELMEAPSWTATATPASSGTSCSRCPNPSSPPWPSWASSAPGAICSGPPWSPVTRPTAPCLWRCVPCPPTCTSSGARSSPSPP